MKNFFKILSAIIIIQILSLANSLFADNNPSSQEVKGFTRTKVLPVDEADQNPEFKKFWDELMEAVKNKDLKFLLEHTNFSIHDVCSNNAGGIQYFMNNWRLIDNPDQSPIWNKLEEILNLGGVFTDEEKKHFVAPYIFVKWPRPFDSHGHSLIISENVKVRSEPSSRAGIIDVLSYEVVKVVYKDPRKLTNEKIAGELHPWKPVIIYSGKKGYVYGKYLRSPFDYYAKFYRDENGVWKMSFTYPSL